MKQFLDMETQNCVCGNDSGTPLFEVSDDNFGTCGNTSVFMKCARCGSLYPQDFPTPESLPSAYAQYYTQGDTKRGFLSRSADLFRQSYMEREAPMQRSILDFGCGSGVYLQSLSAIRPDAKLFGTDIGPPNVVEGYEWISDIEGRQFDHITLSHVLEHVPDPSALLKDLARALAPRGTIWISTPNARSFLIERLGAKARDVDFPRHRSVMTRSLIEEMADDAGFQVSWRRGPIVNSALNLKFSLGNMEGGKLAAALGSIPDLLSRDKEPELVFILTHKAQ